MIRFGLPIIALLALIFSVTAIIKMHPVHASAPPPAPPPQATYPDTIAAIGLVEPRSENIAISTPLPGLVMRVLVKAGDKVDKDAPLFVLDERDLKAELQVRRATLQLAKSRLEKLQQAPRREDIPPLEAQVQEAEAALADARVQQQLIESVTDRRAIKEEDLRRRRIATQAAKAKLESAKSRLALTKAGTWQPDLAVAKTEVAQAEQQVKWLETNLDRLTVRAPITGTILKVDVRPGEYAQIGPMEKPLILMGDISQLHIRAEIDEYEASRVRADSTAEASEHGNARQKVPLQFVRFEPYVVPKRSLTGSSNERVDTRVLQVIYRVADTAKLYVGQQMDVFIAAQEGGN